LKVSVARLPGARLDIVGHEGGVVPVAPDQLQSIHLYVTLDKQAAKALKDSATPFDFVITDIATTAATEHAATFQAPPR
jgi:hypothetical protein